MKKFIEDFRPSLLKKLFCYANNVTNTLSATITSTEDTTGIVPINRGLGNLAFDSIFADFTTYQQLPAGDTVITLPNSPAFQVYVKNIDASLNLIVKFTPQGGAQQVSPVMIPGDVFVLWQSNTGPATAGITALTLNASGAGLAVELFIGG